MDKLPHMEFSLQRAHARVFEPPRVDVDDLYLMDKIRLDRIHLRREKDPVYRRSRR